jgi:hypothetical protein
VIGPWDAPNITPDALAGIGSMSPKALFHYLHFGRVAGKPQGRGNGIGHATELEQAQ